MAGIAVKTPLRDKPSLGKPPKRCLEPRRAAQAVAAKVEAPARSKAVFSGLLRPSGVEPASRRRSMARWAKRLRGRPCWGAGHLKRATEAGARVDGPTCRLSGP